MNFVNAAQDSTAKPSIVLHFQASVCSIHATFLVHIILIFLDATMVGQVPHARGEVR